MRVERCVSRGLSKVTGYALGPYQTAIVRIGFGAAWLFFLLREWPHRHELYGPDGPWSFGLGKQLIDTNHAFTVLMWASSDSWFELVYLVAMAAAAAMVLGWHTRAVTVLFMVGVLSLQNRSVFMGDGGDNVIHLMSLYLILTRCSRVWSLDARRARRALSRAGAARRDADRTDASANARGRGDGAPTDAGGDAASKGGDPVAGSGGVVLWAVLGAILVGGTIAGAMSIGWTLFFWALWVANAVWWCLNKAVAVRGGSGLRELRTVCDILANLAHNGVLLVIMVEVCLIYSTAGWFKIQGSRWQDGTAVYYPMNLDYFTPWPELSHLLAGNGLTIFLVTYGTVITQVAFPFTLFNRRVKNVLLTMMIMEHVGIAVLLGLPFFSMAMIAADAVFLPTVFLVWIGRHVTAFRTRVRGRLPGGTGHREPVAPPAPRTAVPEDSAVPASAPVGWPGDRNG
ncbi:HTTM domain-containing protein [Streptomyces reniochalinae]|uniref:HTTM domain-containing protein n=1 Tax=Streptomyces reniochalinae TaxID=2250578 RepID=A0A367EIU9_9ACTN|nr:HTTM domain-containing protein [Streptomyces reniochalinae]RCG17140.1 HTTM domain-containing protein [Streptomyces reniochalinae]